MSGWHWRRVRFKRWMQDHYWFIPGLDGLIMFAGLLAILCALAVLLSILLGEFGIGPLSGWQHIRHR